MGDEEPALVGEGGTSFPDTWAITDRVKNGGKAA